MMRKVCRMGVALAWSLGLAVGAETDVKVLFMGFEKDKIVNGWLKLKEDKGDWCFVSWPGDRGRWYQALKKGDATEGEWVAAFDIGGKSFGSPDRSNHSALPWSYFQPGFQANIAPSEKFTETAQSREGTGYSTPGNRLESAMANHWWKAKFYTRYAEGGVSYSPAAFPTNWTGYSFLRLDVKIEKGEFSFRMAFEDDKVAPPVEKRFVAPGGQWTTCEIDLDAAVKERGVDLSKIVNFWLYLEESKEPARLYIDNVRLATRSAKTTCPVLKGGPKVPRPCAKMPEIDKTSLKPNREKLAMSEPFKTEFKTGQDRNGKNAPVGLIRLWAYDNHHMVMDAPGTVRLQYTTDGGKTWQPVKLPKEAAGFPGGVTSNRGAATGIDAFGGIYFLGNYGDCLYHCAPPVDSVYCRKLLFTGTEWIASPMYIVGGETRKCSQGRRLTLLNSGRAWLAYRVHERRGPCRIHAVYSDDGGMTWRGVGVEGKLTQTLADTLVVGPSREDSGTGVLFHDALEITPHKGGVAVVDGWRCSYFDGTKWTALAPVDGGKLFGKNVSPLLMSIASLDNGNEILIGADKGLLAWDGESWRLDTRMPRMFLTVCGDRIVGFSVEDRDGGSRILFWKRSADGKWESREIASEPTPIMFNFNKRGNGERSLAVPKRSPLNFAPVAWTCKGETWVKVLRVPVD